MYVQNFWESITIQKYILTKHKTKNIFEVENIWNFRFLPIFSEKNSMIRKNDPYILASLLNFIPDKQRIRPIGKLFYLYF